MNEGDRQVIGGVDAHADTHHAAALDGRGALLATESFAVSAVGYCFGACWRGGTIYDLAAPQYGCERAATTSCACALNCVASSDLRPRADRPARLARLRLSPVPAELLG